MEEVIENLEKVIELADDMMLPEEAKEWAEGAMETASSILETIDDMTDKGIDAPTTGQETALENINDASLRWLEGVEEDAT